MSKLEVGRARHCLRRHSRQSQQRPPPLLTVLRALEAMVRPFAARLAQAVRPRRLPQSHPRFQQQRFASSTPSTEELQKKAQDALGTVQKGLGQALETGKRLLGPVGEKAGNMLGGTFCSRVRANVFCWPLYRVVRTRFGSCICRVGRFELTI